MNQPPETVVRVLGEQLGRSTEDITRDTKLRADLGVDSLDNVEILMQLEEELLIEIPDQEAETLFDGELTVGRLIDFCAHKVATR